MMHINVCQIYHLEMMVDVGPRLEMPHVVMGIVVPKMGIVERPLTIVVMVAFLNAMQQLLRHRL